MGCAIAKEEPIVAWVIGKQTVPEVNAKDSEDPYSHVKRVEPEHSQGGGPAGFFLPPADSNQVHAGDKERNNGGSRDERDQNCFQIPFSSREPPGRGCGQSQAQGKVRRADIDKEQTL